MRTRALVLAGYGINCEQETKIAIEKVGGEAEIVHMNDLFSKVKSIHDYNFLVFPGGFSFGDDLGSGKVWANKLKFKLKDELFDFIKNQNLILGICNGFQVLLKLGILPIPDFQQRATLTLNSSAKFEDRWVWLKANQNSPCIFTKGIDYLTLPVRHAEGRFLTEGEEELKRITDGNLYALQYVDRQGRLGAYPWNPNGSLFNIAGLCDETGRIFGLMPHPEGFIEIFNCPYWKNANLKEAQGLRIFKNAVEYLASQ